MDWEQRAIEQAVKRYDQDGEAYASKVRRARVRLTGWSTGVAWSLLVWALIVWLAFK